MHFALWDENQPYVLLQTRKRRLRNVEQFAQGEGQNWGSNLGLDVVKVCAFCESLLRVPGCGWLGENHACADSLAL